MRLRVPLARLTCTTCTLAILAHAYFLSPIIQSLTSCAPQDVLVESFEDGDLISTFVNQPTYKHRFVLAETGLHCYLQMLLRDNFIHAVRFLLLIPWVYCLVGLGGGLVVWVVHLFVDCVLGTVVHAWQSCWLPAWR